MIFSSTDLGTILLVERSKPQVVKTILIVEDNHADRQLSSALLSHAGFKIAVANDVEAAWEWLENHATPNLILLDILLPGASGLDLCRKIREHQKYKNIPVLFCSAKSEEFDRFWALRQGGNEYITKPYLPQKLVDKVTQYVSE